MKAILVEDSRLARLELSEQLKDFDEIEVNLKLPPSWQAKPV